MKKFILAFLYIALIGCSDVEFSETDEGLRKTLDQNDILINYGAEYTQIKDVHLSIIGKEDQEMYITNDPTCKTGGQWESYAGEKEWKLNHENNLVKVYVKFKGKRGVESSCMNDAIIHDNIPPDLDFLNRPNYLNNYKEMKVGLKAQDNISGVDQTFCALEGNTEFVKCYDNLMFQDITEGEHSLKFTAIDKAGNRSNPIELNWYTDLTPPKISFHQLPAKLVNQTESVVSFEGRDESGIAGFNCKLNEESFSSCKAEVQLKKLKNGNQKFTVFAVDKAGNFSESIFYDWEVDNLAPTVQITKHPNNYTRGLWANFEFEGKDKGKLLNQFKCQVNDLNWQTCNSPFSTSLVQKGTQIFRVKTIDLAGNESRPVTFSWVIDLTPPDLKILTMPKKLTNSDVANFNLLATDLESGVENYKCWLDNIEVSCSRSNFWLGLQEGSHYFEAIAYDKVGNISEKAKYDWVIDLQPPVVEFTKTPANYIAETMTEFAFKANDNISSRFNYYCKGNAGSYQLCGNPYTIKDLKEGGQTFSVRAEDEAGNLSQPIAHTWNVDLTPPDIVFVKKPIDHKNDRTSVFNLNIEDKLSGFEKAWCGLKGHLQECAKNQKLEYKIEQPGLYEFEVVAMDKVGNKSSLSHTWQIFDKYKSINQLVEINAQSFDVDILFVVDNSDSMAEEQRNMADRIDNFISKIEDLNWHIAVTSTDPREEAPIGNCDIGLEQFCEHEKLEHGDGGFVKFGNNQRILTPDVLQAQKLLGNAIQLGTGGSSSEEGIRATYRVIEKSQSSTNPSHQQFFRANAALAVILISDEDESDNEFKNKPHNLFQLVKDNWPQKSFKFHSMINLKQFNCINNDLGFGKEYEKMSHLTEGIIGSVCQDNYSEDLSSIGSEVRKQVSFVDLKCLPQDKNNDGTPDLEVELEDGQSVPSFKIEGLKVIFDNPLPAGKHVLKYVCLI